MSATRSNDRDERLAHASGTSITQHLARVSAVHPWRVLAAWGLILAASVVAIGTLLGSAFTSDGSITTNPDSIRAQQVIADNFSQADRIDDAVDHLLGRPHQRRRRSSRPSSPRSGPRSRPPAPPRPSGTPTPPTSPASPRTGTPPW